MKIGEYPEAGAFDMKYFRKMGQVRKLQGKYHLAMDMDMDMIKMFLHCPVMGAADILPFLTGLLLNMQVMRELTSYDLRDKGRQYQVPVYYVLGENDQQTPVEIATSYFGEITAPEKNLYLIKNAGHLTMLDNMDDYRTAICEIVKAAVLKQPLFHCISPYSQIYPIRPAKDGAAARMSLGTSIK